MLPLQNLDVLFVLSYLPMARGTSWIACSLRLTRSEISFAMVGLEDVGVPFISKWVRDALLSSSCRGLMFAVCKFDKDLLPLLDFYMSGLRNECPLAVACEMGEPNSLLSLMLPDLKLVDRSTFILGRIALVIFSRFYR